MEYFKLTAAMHNLGCKVNAYEADAMLEELRRAGIRIVPWDDAVADIYIIIPAPSQTSPTGSRGR